MTRQLTATQCQLLGIIRRSEARVQAVRLLAELGQGRDLDTQDRLMCLTRRLLEGASAEELHELVVKSPTSLLNGQVRAVVTRYTEQVCDSLHGWPPTFLRR